MAGIILPIVYQCIWQTLCSRIATAVWGCPCGGVPTRRGWSLFSGHVMVPPGRFSEGFSLQRLQRIEACRLQDQRWTRHMSDLETLEADMMRDRSSADAASATLRLEESQPGLDPD